MNKTIAELKADKASKTNQIFNRMLKILRETIIERLILIFQACIDVEDYSKSFWETKIIVFKKIKKNDYTFFKVHKSIALLNTMSKVLKSIMINKITELAKKNSLFSKSQVSAKKEKNTKSTLKLLTEEIHTIWRQKNKVVIIMNVDVIEIYDHVSHIKLFHNLKKRKISNWIIQWVKSFLKERKSSITFEKKTSAISRVNAKISQKFSVLFILYLFFNANLLKICKQLKRKTIFIEFVDNVNVLTYNTNTEKNCKTLKKLHNVFTTWFRRHEITFSSIKYELIHLSRNSKKFNMKTMINLEKMRFISKTNIRILKFQINTKLQWKCSIKKLQNKMINQTLALTKLIAFTWKVSFNKVKHIYKTMIKSNITYESMI